MWILNGMIFLAIALFMQLPNAHAQNACTAAATAACSPYTCVQTGTVYSCLCPNAQLAQTAAGCGAISPTQSPILPNQCGNVNCPAGATCVPTNQNPAQYVCVCPNNFIANPDCSTTQIPNNPCLNNPCTNGGTCVVSSLTNQAICLCPANSYGPNCSTSCRSVCDLSW